MGASQSCIDTVQFPASATVARNFPASSTNPLEFTLLFGSGACDAQYFTGQLSSPSHFHTAIDPRPTPPAYLYGPDGVSYECKGAQFPVIIISKRGPLVIPDGSMDVVCDTSPTNEGSQIPAGTYNLGIEFIVDGSNPLEFANVYSVPFTISH